METRNKYALPLSLVLALLLFVWYEIQHSQDTGTGSEASNTYTLPPASDAGTEPPIPIPPPPPPTEDYPGLQRRLLAGVKSHTAYNDVYNVGDNVASISWTEGQIKIVAGQVYDLDTGSERNITTNDTDTLDSVWIGVMYEAHKAWDTVHAGGHESHPTITVRLYAANGQLARADDETF